jgi:hypothetical protein
MAAHQIRAEAYPSTWFGFAHRWSLRTGFVRHKPKIGFGVTGQVEIADCGTVDKAKRGLS